MRSATASIGKAAASKPESWQRRSRTHVQCLLSGEMGSVVPAPEQGSGPTAGWFASSEFQLAA
jgi:hypothetical protein